MIGEQERECHDDTEEYEVTVMVDMVREECDTLMVSQCDTEYTQECDEARCQETQGEEECRMVMMEVCGEVTRQIEEDCWTLHRMDCESHWVGEGENRVWEVIPESCVRRPYERCDALPGPVTSPVTLECRRLPQRRCSPSVTKRRCPRSACRQVPWTFCSKEPRRTNCRMVEETMPRQITRTRSVRRCEGDK